MRKKDDFEKLNDKNKNLLIEIMMADLILTNTKKIKITVVSFFFKKLII